MRACAVALAVLLLCVAVTAMPPVKRLIRTAGVRGSNSSLRAGAAKINGTLPVGVPLAGYNHGQRRAARYPLPKFTQYTTWMAPSVGVMDPTWVRAVVIEEGGESFAVVTIDAIGADSVLMRLAWEIAAAQGLQVPLENIVMGGSHSHSGPGGISPFFLWAIAPAIDLLVPSLQLELANSVAQALLQAQASLQPAQLAIGVANLTSVTQNRRAGESPYVQSGTIDPTLGVFRIEDLSGNPIAAIWNFAVHGTCYGPENMLASGDIMGKSCEFIEAKLGVPALFVNSDAGDIDPTNAACSNAPNFNGAMNISTAVVNVWSSLTPTTNVQIASASQIVDFGPTNLNYTLARFNNCTSGGFLDICSLCAAIDCDLNAHMPSSWIDNTPRFTAFRFDIDGTSFGIVTFPGEGLVELGWEVRNDTQKLKFDNTLIFGYSNSHMGYFATPNEYDVGGYESQLTLWGIQTSQLVRTGAVSTITSIAPATVKRLTRN